ncbi:uncharacterized protein PITG_14928 [Phytophthora infestans T30-4]|uniref:RxLR effector protein n=1 Tax=Phytophthora infestans (strain T30-4) TaxID=403677 RepID=D0NPC3_PHYIT|nr:uncharacterized protein PITG_14928 [Phytophthora infestans T30-4]EEY62465.1 hypothetical protein PITG_14928 [Phytophthora infestans T30-4]|eukprot:XP_002899101.1 hypothetical protein PITG_14928 [Phytophthora infestans T30-4]
MFMRLLQTVLVFLVTFLASADTLAVAENTGQTEIISPVITDSQNSLRGTGKTVEGDDSVEERAGDAYSKLVNFIGSVGGMRGKVAKWVIADKADELVMGALQLKDLSVYLLMANKNYKYLRRFQTARMNSWLKKNPPLSDMRLRET